MSNVKFSGGDKINEIFMNAGKGGISSVDIGVFESAKYPDGTYVAEVAVKNEFGHGVPERPALRVANKENEKNLLTIIKNSIDPEKMIITDRIGGLIGASHQGAIQQSITKLRSPANSPETIEAKKSSNPLIDTGLYRNSISFKVNK